MRGFSSDTSRIERRKGTGGSDEIGNLVTNVGAGGGSNPTLNQYHGPSPPKTTSGTRGVSGGRGDSFGVNVDAVQTSWN